MQALAERCSTSRESLSLAEQVRSSRSTCLNDEQRPPRYGPAGKTGFRLHRQAERTLITLAFSRMNFPSLYFWLSS
jgi:hypothetical protein